MSKKRIAALVAAAALAVSTILSGCGGAADNADNGSTAANTEATYTIGICQLVQHPALDDATRGFRDALTELLGDAVTFDEQNAGGESNTCSTIVNGFVQSNVDLIMANATPALQAAQAATTDIPILATSITDYATALEIADWTGTTGMNISGTSDLAPLADQAAMIQELCPDVQKVAILYCSAEANSAYQARVIGEELDALNIAHEDYTFADSNDLAMVCQNAVDECDVVYIPTDNTAASCTGTINPICEDAGVPVIAGEEGICQGCGVATLSISYYSLGYITGQMAYEILVNGADVSTMEVQYAADLTKEYIADRATALGLTIPEDYVAIEAE